MEFVCVVFLAVWYQAVLFLHYIDFVCQKSFVLCTIFDCSLLTEELHVCSLILRHFWSPRGDIPSRRCAVMAEEMMRPFSLVGFSALTPSGP